tara:strand:+ start:549 stop:1040 length:492 start_codon:yes stop_codon:yes gene_type:complete
MEENLLNILITVGIAMLPVLELRGALPFAMGVLGMPLWSAFLWSVVGNILIVVILLKFLNPVTTFLMKHSKFFNHWLNALFHKTRHKHSDRFNEIGALCLITFVAIPLPVTGAWTGSLVAFLFGVRFWPALILISIGVLCAGVLVSLGFESITAIIDYIAALT